MQFPTPTCFFLKPRGVVLKIEVLRRPGHSPGSTIALLKLTSKFSPSLIVCSQSPSLCVLPLGYHDSIALNVFFHWDIMTQSPQYVFFHWNIIPQSPSMCSSIGTSRLNRPQHVFFHWDHDSIALNVFFHWGIMTQTPSICVLPLGYDDSIASICVLPLEYHDSIALNVFFHWGTMTQSPSICVLPLGYHGYLFRC
jgi:hypothetical protein